MVENNVFHPFCIMLSPVEAAKPGALPIILLSTEFQAHPRYA
jgi:hypothetical protein